jgi:hypothetical protein
MSIYKNKPGIKYPAFLSTGYAKTYQHRIKQLHHQRVYINSKLFIDLELPNVFTDYYIQTWDKNTPGFMDNSILINTFRPGVDSFKFWSAHMSFAIYCASTCLGVSAEHLEKGSGLLRALYRFHIYYHVRKVLHMLNVKTPGESGFSRYNNMYSGEGFNRVCLEYGADPNDNYYNYSLQFISNAENYYKEVKKDEYGKLILDKSKGLSDKALGLISESVREYCYVLLSAQVGARGSIYHPTAKRNYLDLFETVINKPVDISSDVERYENLLKYARSKVDFPVAYGSYMLPSNMLIRLGNVENYNNSMKLADNTMVIGETNGHVNNPHVKTPIAKKEIQKDIPPTQNKKQYKPPTNKKKQYKPPINKPPTEKLPEKLPEKEKNADKSLGDEHEGEKVALILLVSTGFGLFYLWRK